MTLVGCKDNRKVIGVLLYSSNDNEVNKILASMEKEIDMSENRIVYKDAQESQMLQNDQFLELIDSGVDLLVVNLVDRLSANIYASKAKSNNIPIVFFNREPLWEDLINYNKAYYVGVNGEGTGHKQAQIIGRMFDNPDDLAIYYDINGNNIIEMVILKGEQGHQSTETIFKTCIDELNEKEFSINILETEYADWNREKAKKQMKKIYYSKNNLDSRGRSKIEVVICNNDEMAMGVIDFIMEEEIYLIDRNEGTYIMPFDIVGAGLTNDSSEAINNRYIYASITGEEETQGITIASLIKDLINNKDINIELFKEVKFESGEDKYNIKGNFILTNGEIIYSKRRPIR